MSRFIELDTLDYCSGSYSNGSRWVGEKQKVFLNIDDISIIRRNSNKYIYVVLKNNVMLEISKDEYTKLLKKMDDYDKIKQENNFLKEENIALRTYVSVMPGGTAYLEAQKRFNDNKDDQL